MIHQFRLWLIRYCSGNALVFQKCFFFISQRRFNRKLFCKLKALVVVDFSRFLEPTNRSKICASVTQLFFSHFTRLCLSQIKILNAHVSALCRRINETANKVSPSKNVKCQDTNNFLIIMTTIELIIMGRDLRPTPLLTLS